MIVLMAIIGHSAGLIMILAASGLAMVPVNPNLGRRAFVAVGTLPGWPDPGPDYAFNWSSRPGGNLSLHGSPSPLPCSSSSRSALSSNRGRWAEGGSIECPLALSGRGARLACGPLPEQHRRLGELRHSGHGFRLRADRPGSRSRLE